MTETECKDLAALFERKRDSDGLLDVKFYVQNLAETGIEEICQEVNRLYAAVDSKKARPLDFGDLAWKA